MERTKEQLMDLMMKRMKEQIKNKKYKMTSQRQVVLRAFVESDSRHLSADDVFEIVRNRLRKSDWRRYIVRWICLQKWIS